jgi:hypothetical protein
MTFYLISLHTFLVKLYFPILLPQWYQWLLSTLLAEMNSRETVPEVVLGRLSVLVSPLKRPSLESL